MAAGLSRAAGRVCTACGCMLRPCFYRLPLPAPPAHPQARTMWPPACSRPRCAPSSPTSGTTSTSASRWRAVRPPRWPSPSASAWCTRWVWQAGWGGLVGGELAGRKPDSVDTRAVIKEDRLATVSMVSCLVVCHAKLPASLHCSMLSAGPVAGGVQRLAGRQPRSL